MPCRRGDDVGVVRYGDGAQEMAREVRVQELRLPWGRHHDPIARLNPRLAQRPGGPEDALPELAVGEPACPHRYRETRRTRLGVLGQLANERARRHPALVRHPPLDG